MEVYRNEITQANPEQRQRGLRVLSLDGGGVRGLSSLHILQYLMKRIDSENPPKPCDYFDLIGGTSTGGLIAIMLGRLRMDIHECITAYKVISRRVFTPKRSKRNILGRGKDLWSLAGAFDSNALADEIARVVEACGLDRNAKLLEKEAHCKVFVCATRAEISTTVRLRNYRTAMTVDEVNCTIVEAARATSAASSFFAPIEIEGQKFVDGATGSNNPVDDVLDEVNTIWPGENSRLERFVSVGTGTPSLKAFGTNLKELASTLVAMAVDTERVAERFQKQDVRANGLSSNYFRFNVRRGLEDVGLEEHAKQGTIIAATNNYLDEYETREKVQEFVEASQPFLSSFEMVSYLHTLNTYDILAELRTIATPVGTTFDWVLESKEMKAWAQGNHQILSIRGKPGCGKSVLLAHLRNSMVNTPVAFFACKDAEHSRRFPEMILSSLLRQILSFQPKLLRYVVPLDRFFGSWKYEQLLESFEGVLTSPDNPGVICMIDALDECDPGTRKRFVKDLRDIFERAGSSTEVGYRRMIITSRNYPDLIFPSRLATTIDLDSSPMVQADLKKFILYKVTDLLEARPDYKSLDVSSIIDKLENRANGMYRLIELLIHELEGATNSSPHALELALDSVPSHLSESYDRIWMRIPPYQQPRARRILKLLLCAFVPLSLEALRVAVALIDTSSEQDIKVSGLNKSADLLGDLGRLFGPLIHVDQTVRLSHHSVKDHFIKIKHENIDHVTPTGIGLEEAHALGALICMRYLNANDLRFSQECVDESSKEFLEYALNFGAKHIAMTRGMEPKLDEEILTFFKAGIWTSRWSQAAPHDLPCISNVFVPPIDNPLTFSAYYHRIDLFGRLIGDGTWFQAYHENRCASVLVYTIYLSMLSMNEEALVSAIASFDKIMLSIPPEYEPVTLLSSPNAEDVSRESFYQLVDYAQSLQLEGLAVNRRIDDQITLHEKIRIAFRTLCPDSFYRDAGEFFSSNTDWSHNTAILLGLYMSWTYGKERMSLLRPDSTIVLAGAKWNRYHVVQLLLDEGAGLQALDNCGATPLHLAASTGNTELVRTILSRKEIDVNAKDSKGETPLHYACRKYTLWDSADRIMPRPKWVSRSRVVKLLLAGGARPREKNDQNNTPFQALARVFVPEWPDIQPTSELNWQQQDLNECIALLITSLDDVLEWDTYGITPLHYASYWWPVSAIKQLLDFLSHFNLPGLLLDAHGHTPLHYAAIRGFEASDEVVQLLYSAGVDPRVCNIFGETPSRIARLYGRRSAFRILSKSAKEADKQAELRLGKTLPTAGQWPRITPMKALDGKNGEIYEPLIETNHDDMSSAVSLQRRTHLYQGQHSIPLPELQSWENVQHPSVELIQKLNQWVLNASLAQQHSSLHPVPSRRVLDLLSMKKYDLARIEYFGSIHRMTLIRPIPRDESTALTKSNLASADSTIIQDLTTTYRPTERKMIAKYSYSQLDEDDEEDWDDEYESEAEPESRIRENTYESVAKPEKGTEQTNIAGYYYSSYEDEMWRRMRKVFKMSNRILRYLIIYEAVFSNTPLLLLLFPTYPLGAPGRTSFERRQQWDFGDKISMRMFSINDYLLTTQRHFEGLIYGWLPTGAQDTYTMVSFPTWLLLFIILGMSLWFLQQAVRKILWICFIILEKLFPEFVDSRLDMIWYEPSEYPTDYVDYGFRNIEQERGFYGEAQYLRRVQTL